MEITFPSLTYGEVAEKLGYTICETADEEYNQMEYSDGVSLVACKGEGLIWLFLDNLTDEKNKLHPKDCLITGLSLGHEAGDINATIRGIGLGSTEQEMLDAFTNCEMSMRDDMVDINDKPFLKYYFNIENETYLYDYDYSFEVQDGVVIEVVLSNGGVVNYSF